MIVWQEIRPRLRRVVAPVAATLVLCYFGYHAIEGNHGLKAWLSLSAEKAKLSEEAALIHGKRERLEQRVSLMKPDSLDPDMLSEQARAVLGYAHPDEVVVYENRSSN
jgi:cell division protein FtsB